MENIKNYKFNDTEVDFGPIVPLMDDDEGSIDFDMLSTDMPILVLKNMVLFPQTVVPITVSRDKSLKSLRDAQSNQHILVFTQTDENIDDPSPSELYPVGTLAHIVREFKMPDGSLTVLLRGRKRVSIDQIKQINPYLKASYTVLEDHMPTDDSEFEAMLDTISALSREIIEISPNIPNETAKLLENIDDSGFLINFISSNVNADLPHKMELMQSSDVKERAEKLISLLQTQRQYAELKSQIDNKTRADLDQQQREYFLQQQMKSIKEELGGDANDREIQDLKERAEQVPLTQEAKTAFDKGIEKLERMNPSTPDFSVVYNHLDILLDLPWSTYTEDKYDLAAAQKVLDKEHYGMDKIKDRILEYLAVLQLKGDLKSPILCFVGPPGIGKTSLGKSIAHAIQRKHVRMSLGGLHDESEIRGHRKTYIGAMPGRVIQSLRKAKTSNPVFILDEIDKIGSDFRGDPSSALLEVLDPEQNHSFYDNYLEVEYDLSKVLFIATANDLSQIQPALRDRLEIIHLEGYSQEEKVEIAKKHLFPKQLEAHGLKDHKPKLNNAFYNKLIENYTRESGVRELDRQLASLMRSVAKDVALNGSITTQPSLDNIEDFLGRTRYSTDKYSKKNPAGVAVGLAWTQVGGDILYIEAALSKGKGGMTLTGNLGDVMKESASTAHTYLKTISEKLGIDHQDFAENTLHIHVPEGATPKDGPSAGITMLTAMASIYTRRKIKPLLAMTGEITLRGQVLPVGGIKEKILAGRRNGIKEIILSETNRKDVEEINPKYIKGLTFYYVDKMDEVLDIALV